MSMQGVVRARECENNYLLDETQTATQSLTVFKQCSFSRVNMCVWFVCM